jgi:hypothetical protein
MHVDQFIDAIDTDKYASWILNHFRLPVILKAKFDPFMKKHQLFCTYQEKRWQVIGASRMGDIWLSKKMEITNANYDLRVNIEKCSDWSNKP